jgi:hypothetical protein
MENGEEATPRRGGSSGTDWDLGGIGEEEPARAPRRRRVWLWLVLILLLGGLAATVGSLYYPEITLRLSFFQKSAPTATSKLAQRTERDKASQDIALRNVSQYMVQNKHIGSILVIEGKAENTSGGPKKGIKLEAKVFDEQGQMLRSKEFVCGKSVSLAQLQSYTKEELESAFNSHLARMKGAKRVDTGEAVSFMALFYSPPQGMAEFSLKVLRARAAGAP